MVRLLRHRQTKGAATDRLDLRPPRHILTLPEADIDRKSVGCPNLVDSKYSKCLDHET